MVLYQFASRFEDIEKYYTEIYSYCHTSDKNKISIGPSVIRESPIRGFFDGTNEWVHPVTWWQQVCISFYHKGYFTEFSW